MSGLTRVPWNVAGPRLLKLARVLALVGAPTVKDSSYWAGGPSIRVVEHDGPELPAATTGTMPAARTACTVANRTDCVQPSSEIEQYQELLTATGAFDGSGFCPFRSQGVI